MYNITAGTSRAGFRAGAGLVVLTLPTVLLGLDVTVMYLALPELSADLRPTPTETLWIMDAYGFLIAGFLITMGTLGDRIGRRRLLIIGSLTFGAASVFAAFSTSAPMLIAARAVLGIAGATLMPSTLALINSLFPDRRQRSLAFGVWATSFALGMAAGPLVGGLLLERFWWGSAFLVALPVVALTVLGAPLLPEYRAPDRGRIDPLSVALSLLALLPIVYAIKHGATAGLDAATGLGVLVGLTAGVLFVRRQQRLTDPLLDLRLLAVPAVAVALTVMLLGLVGVGASLYLVTQHLQLVEGLTPLNAGLWMGPPALLMLVAAIGAPLLTRLLTPGTVVAASMAASVLGYLLLASADGPGSLAPVVIGFGLVYLGLGAIAALGTDLVVSGAPAERAGSAASLSETVQELGVAVGVAVLGSVAAAVYRAAAAPPPGLPEAVAAAFGESLTGAVSVAGQLPVGLLDQARTAQTSGMAVVSVVSAGIALVLVVLSATVLRRAAAGPSDDAATADRPGTAGRPRSGEVLRR